jgi:hypothetical protein
LMRFKVLVVALLCLLPSVVGAQDGSFIRYYPPAGATGLTSSGTAITSTLPFLAPDGSASAPSYSFSGATNWGLYRDSTSIVFSLVGTNAMALNTSIYLKLHSGGAFAWSASTNATGVADLYMVRDAAATLQFGLDAATATAQTIKGPDSTGATVAGASLTLKGGAGTSGIANGGALILAGGANNSTGEPGAVTISDGGTKPTCAAGIRGSIWYDAGGAGVADTFEVCAKAAADTYAWRVLATIP